MGSPMKGL